MSEITDEMVEAVARPIYDAMEGPIANQDFSRQIRQWEAAKTVARAALEAVAPMIRAQGYNEGMEDAAKMIETHQYQNGPGGVREMAPASVKGDMHHATIAAALRKMKKPTS